MGVDEKLVWRSRGVLAFGFLARIRACGKRPRVTIPAGCVKFQLTGVNKGKFPCSFMSRKQGLSTCTAARPREMQKCNARYIFQLKRPGDVILRVPCPVSVFPLTSSLCAEHTLEEAPNHAEKARLLFLRRGLRRLAGVASLTGRGRCAAGAHRLGRALAPLAAQVCVALAMSGAAVATRGAAPA